MFIVWLTIRIKKIKISLFYVIRPKTLQNSRGNTACSGARAGAVKFCKTVIWDSVRNSSIAGLSKFTSRESVVLMTLPSPPPPGPHPRLIYSSFKVLAGGNI